MWKNCYETVALHLFTWKASIYFAWPNLAVVYHCADTFRVHELGVCTVCNLVQVCTFSVCTIVSMAKTVDGSSKKQTGALFNCVSKKQTLQKYFTIHKAFNTVQGVYGIISEYLHHF
jgi:hypothetical protein